MCQAKQVNLLHEMRAKTSKGRDNTSMNAGDVNYTMDFNKSTCPNYVADKSCFQCVA